MFGKTSICQKRNLLEKPLFSEEEETGSTGLTIEVVGVVMNSKLSVRNHFVGIKWIPTKEKSYYPSLAF